MLLVVGRGIRIGHISGPFIDVQLFIIGVNKGGGSDYIGHVSFGRKELIMSYRTILSIFAREARKPEGIEFRLILRDLRKASTEERKLFMETYGWCMDSISLLATFEGYCPEC